MTLFQSADKRQLADILDSMDVPAMRRDLENSSNLRWLSRNLAANNSDHPHISEALALLKTIMRGKR